METQLFGKGGILLNRKLFVFCFFLFIIFLFNCKEEKEVNSEDTHEIEYLNKNEIKGKYHFLDSISNFRNFPSEKIKYKKLNENLSSIEIKDKENQIFSKGLIITNTEKKYLWWDIQYQDIVFKIEYITEYEKINQQKVYKANNKLDTVQSFYFTTERKGSDLIINYFEHKYTDDDSIYIDYRINGKSFETIKLKKNGFKSTVILPVEEDYYSSSLPIILKGHILSAYKIGDYIYPREMLILDTIR